MNIGIHNVGVEVTIKGKEEETTVPRLKAVRPAQPEQQSSRKLRNVSPGDHAIRHAVELHYAASRQ